MKYFSMRWARSFTDRVSLSSFEMRTAFATPLFDHGQSSLETGALEAPGAHARVLDDLDDLDVHHPCEAEQPVLLAIDGDSFFCLT